MSKRFIITIITLVIIAVAASVAIFFAKGYTVSTKEKRIIGTGIVTITSEPDAASVFVDEHLTTATNATISSLPAKTYSIKLTKEGFIPWEKSITVKEGIVTDLKVTLFPAAPTIYPLTFTGVTNPILSPSGSKLGFIVPSSSAGGGVNRKAGVWVWTQSLNQPIAFAKSSEPHQIATSSTADFSKATLRWSPDSKQVLATVDQNNYLLDSDRLNSDPRDITAILSATIQSWEEDTKIKDTARILTIKDLSIRKLASSSASLKWSPDETKFMYTESSVISHQTSDSLKAEDSLKFKIYDLETKEQYNIPDARVHLWLPNSRHIILVEQDQVSIVDFDGTNKAVIFAGKFEDNFVFPWPDSSRLVIITSFPTPTASEPNLYGINLK